MSAAPRRGSAILGPETVPGLSAVSPRFRNRIVEQRVVTADELRTNPLNWRKHPAHQAAALRGVLDEVGIAAPLTAYYSEEANGALTLIDGHLRLSTGSAWPTDILDVSDAEARLLLAALDPLAALAEVDAAALDALLRDVQTEDAAVLELLTALAAQAGLIPSPVEPPSDFAEYDEEIETAYHCPKCGYTWSGKPK